MKIAVINMSGNVGKTMVARQLLAPRLAAEVIPVESINADAEIEANAIRGRQFASLMDLVAPLARAIVDVGASNVEDLLESMRIYRGSVDEFDLFIVPTVAQPKQMRDTLTTVAILRSRGVEPERIRLVFNMVDYRDVLSTVFEPIFAEHQRSKSFKLNPDAAIHTNELFDQLGSDSVSDIAADETDYKALRDQATNPEEKITLTRQLGRRRLAQGVVEEFDAVYKALMS